jgi:hypothetical protein
VLTASPLIEITDMKTPACNGDRWAVRVPYSTRYGPIMASAMPNDSTLSISMAPPW